MFCYDPDRFFVLIQAMTGDKSDNVPGVPSLDKAKAAALLNTYGSIQAILDHIDQVSALYI